MKKILLAIIGVLLITGCANKDMVTYYENTKAGDKIDSYQIDLRIHGTFDKKNYSEIVKIDNYKETQYKIDNISKNDVFRIPEIKTEEQINAENTEIDLESPMRDPMLDMMMQDNAYYVIDGKNYEKKDGKYVEVDSLMYSNPNVYLETVSKGTNVEFLADEKEGEETYKVYTFKVKKADMKPILEDGVLKDLVLKDDVSAKLWVNKDNRIYRVIYYLRDGSDKVEINVGVYRIDSINDMSNQVR